MSTTARPSTRRPARALTMLVAIAATVLSAGLINQGVAHATETCKGGLFDGYNLITWRDEQLCKEGGGVPRHTVTDDGTVPPYQVLER